MQRNDAVIRLHDMTQQLLFRNRCPLRVRQEEIASTGDMPRG